MVHNYCLGFAFNYFHNEVLLIKKNKPNWQKGKYNGVGGKLEEGETALEAMVREFEEESGVPTHMDQWKEVCMMLSDETKDHPDSDEWRVTVFAVELTNEQWGAQHSCTAEIICPFQPDKLYYYEETFIDNIIWLVPMSLNVLQTSINYIIYN